MIPTENMNTRKKTTYRNKRAEKVVDCRKAWVVQIFHLKTVLTTTAKRRNKN